MANLLEALATEEIAAATIHTSNDSYAHVLRQRSLTVSTGLAELDLVGDWKGMLKAVVVGPWVWLQYGWHMWQQRGSDSFIAYDFTAKIIGTFWASLFDIPVVWIEFASITPLLDRLWHIPALLYRTALPQVDQLITISAHSKEILQTELTERGYNGPLHMIPCGMPLEEISQYETAETTSKRIVCVSRLQAGKGQDLLIRAFAQVLSSHPDATLHIVGEGGTKTSLKQLASELNIQSQVIFRGFVDDALLEIAQADICVFPTVWDMEGFGLVAIEAMALGTPLVAFDHGPIGEIVTNGETGLLATASDIKALATHITTLLEDDALQEKISAAAREHVQQTYDIRQIAHQYADVLDKVHT